jgi:dTDP-4-dehydrorhamnose 3,5-epimerase
MKLTKTNFFGLYEINPTIIKDSRGYFIKTFHHNSFTEMGLNTEWKEEYFSSSIKNVIRGLHFQTPPYEHIKLVTCISGAVLDVVVDLRKESKTFKSVFSTELNASNSKQLYIPKGCAHGFLALENNTIMHYKVSSEYNQSKDMGILWNSIDFNWKVNNPILSERDKSHPSIFDYSSPF